MPDAHKNFAVSAVATAPSPATSGTSLVVTAGTGTLFPAVSFNAVICPASTQPTTTNAEIVRVTTVSTDTFTITRTQESTSARTVIVGDQIFAAVSAKTLTDVEGDVALRALIASPTFTGTPAAPTAAVDTNTTQLATTAMVLAQAASATPIGDATTGVVGTSTRYARGDHVHPTGSLLGPPLVVARTGDSTGLNTQTTPQSDSVLLWAIPGTSTDIYFVEAFLSFNAANNAMDIKVGWATVPTGTTIRWGYGWVAGSTFQGSAALINSGTAQALLTESTTAVFPTLGGGGKTFAFVNGFVYSGGTSGNINLAWSQNTSDGSNLILEKGSFLRITKLV